MSNIGNINTLPKWAQEQFTMMQTSEERLTARYDRLEREAERLRISERFLSEVLEKIISGKFPALAMVYDLQKQFGSDWYRTDITGVDFSQPAIASITGLPLEIDIQEASQWLDTLRVDLGLPPIDERIDPNPAGPQCVVFASCPDCKHYTLQQPDCPVCGSVAE